MIVELILARREIEALKLELAHSHATCDELREMLTKAKSDCSVLALEVDEANESIAKLNLQLVLAKAGQA